MTKRKKILIIVQAKSENNGIFGLFLGLILGGILSFPVAAENIHSTAPGPAAMERIELVQAVAGDGTTADLARLLASTISNNPDLAGILTEAAVTVVPSLAGQVVEETIANLISFPGKDTQSIASMVRSITSGAVTGALSVSGSNVEAAAKSVESITSGATRGILSAAGTKNDAAATMVKAVTTGAMKTAMASLGSQQGNAGKTEASARLIAKAATFGVARGAAGNVSSDGVDVIAALVEAATLGVSDGASEALSEDDGVSATLVSLDISSDVDSLADADTDTSDPVILTLDPDLDIGTDDGNLSENDVAALEPTTENASQDASPN